MRCLLLAAAAAAAAVASNDRGAGAWPYSPRSNWSTVPKFYFATTNLTTEDTIDDASMEFLQQFSLIVMPKIQGPNTRNLTDPARPTPGCCAEERIGRAAAIIKRQHHDPDARVLMYISSSRLFPYYRLTEQFDASDYLHHRNGSVYTITVGGPGQQWWYDVHTLDLTREAVADKFLRGVRETLVQYRPAINGVFADSSGDLRVVGGANMHLNQTADFEAAWDAGHARMLTRMQAVVTSVLGPRGLLVANNADRPNVHGRNFENLGPTASLYVTDESLANRSFAGDSIEALQHEEAAARVALVRGGYYTTPGSVGWEKGYANCLPPSAFKEGRWDTYASHIFNRTLAAFLIGAGAHSFFQCTPGYVGKDVPARPPVSICSVDTDQSSSTAWAETLAPCSQATTSTGVALRTMRSYASHWASRSQQLEMRAVCGRGNLRPA